VKYKITPSTDHVAIDVDELAGRKDATLAAFRSCAAGTCACPTNEYAKLSGIAVESRGDAVRIVLTPKAGATIDVAEVARCLDHTAKSID
jgi:hypothetical protein